MQQTLSEFIRALRAADVRVSPAEAIDANRAVASIGYADRLALRDALCVTLAKTPEEVARYETCFDLFFRRDEFTGADASAPSRLDPGTDEASLQLPLARMVLAGDREGLAQAMERAANDVGAANIQIFLQRGLIARRVLDRMGLRDLEQLSERLSRDNSPAANALSRRLETGRRMLLDEARAFVDRQFELYARSNAQRWREESLTDMRLGSIGRHDLASMQRLVERMAKRLAVRYSRRIHHAKRGRLDVRRTIRRSMAHDGIPFETVWKEERIERPKIAVLCDVSRSVAAAARFLLLFLYSLNEVIAKLNAYAFSDRLIEVTDILENRKVDVAIPEILERIGFRSTNYGQSLDDFCNAFLKQVDRHTTIIVLGDGRSNYSDPRVDLLRTMRERSRSVIWLNPEPETFWGQGDSEMHRYARYCHVARTCNTLRHLETIVDDVLKSHMR
ncbi:MAG: vWA domain-containing protein [Burkholderiales bacterium]